MSYHYATTIIEQAKNEFDELLEDCTTRVNIMTLMKPESEHSLFGWIGEDCIVLDMGENFAFTMYFLNRFEEVKEVEQFNDYFIYSDKTFAVKQIIDKFNEKS